MLPPLVTQLRWCKHFEEQMLQFAARCRQPAARLFDGTRLDGLRDDRNPEPEVAARQATEWLTKRKMADDVESCVRKPVGDVANLTSARKLVHLITENINVVSDEIFLFQEGLGAKGVRESSALTCMVDITGHGDGDDTRNCLD